MDGRMLSDFGVTTLPSLVEQEVGTAGLLDLGAGCGIQVHILIKALLMRIHDGMKAHGIVQTCLDMAGSVGCCTVKVTDTDGNGLYTALEIRAYRRTEAAELIRICRALHR